MQGGIERPEHQNGEGVPAFLYMELLINDNVYTSYKIITDETNRINTDQNTNEGRSLWQKTEKQNIMH